jgi:hypothetical protein
MEEECHHRITPTDWIKMPEDEPQMVDEFAVTLQSYIDNTEQESADSSKPHSSLLLSSMIVDEEGYTDNITEVPTKPAQSSLLSSMILDSSGETADLPRVHLSTGLTALRMRDGLNRRNSSVEDFLSLAAAGDIPHQDPALLNVPLMQHQQNKRNGI